MRYNYFTKGYLMGEGHISKNMETNLITRYHLICALCSDYMFYHGISCKNLLGEVHEFAESLKNIEDIKPGDIIDIFKDYLEAFVG